MTTNELNPDQIPSNPFTQSDQDFGEVDRQLARTNPWVRFVSILGFLMCAMTPVSLLSATLPGAVQWTLVSAGVVVFAFLFYLIPSILLWSYGSRIGEYLRDGSSVSFSGALSAQRAFWRYLGVIVLIIILLYFVVVASLVAVAMIGAMR